MNSMNRMGTIHHEVVLANPPAVLEQLQAHRGANFISIESYLAWMPDDELLEIFRAVGYLPRLDTFRISFSFQRFRQLPVLPIPSQALAQILRSAKHLDTLTLDEVRFLFRDDRDMETLSLALQQAPYLKNMTLYNCFPVEPNETDTRLDPNLLANALANMHALEELNLIFTLEGPQWITALLRQSCCSACMKRLRINVPDGSLRGEPICKMAQELESNATLRELSIRCPLNEEAGIVLSKVLHNPRSQMQELYLQMDKYEYAIPIAEALHTNISLKSFELRVWRGGDRTPLLDAYEEMIQHNTVIEQLIIDNGRYGLTPTIDFYLQLNQAGRRHLLEGDKITRKEWIDFLLPHKRNLSFVYYVVSLNPSLCQTEYARCVMRSQRYRPYGGYPNKRQRV